MHEIELYDTTLRDGAQHEGISLSVDDKVAITRKLDLLGVHYVEGGWPGANPKDDQFFARAQDLRLRNATLTAFGSTRRAGADAGRDANLQALMASGAPVITLVGKSWDLHVTGVLETSLDENLSMIGDSVAFLRAQGRRVFFDAEHFFDGFKADRDYAMQTVHVAAGAGAECVVLCDTNGGTLPDEIAEIVAAVLRDSSVSLGIHTHNDADTAVAGALAALRAGATQVQGTINGYGERCGNADLISIIADLKLKMGIECITGEQLESLTEVSRFVAEVANMPAAPSQPYVGASAFAHKAGLHASATARVEDSYQHTPPEKVGNSTRILVSELSGRGNIMYKVRELGLNVELAQGQATRLVELVKLQESRGFHYEGADASFELLVRRMQPGYRQPFTLTAFSTTVEKREQHPDGDDLVSEAVVKVQIGNDTIQAASHGNGPVNALDHALRKALVQHFPDLEAIRLVDYKVRVVSDGQGTGAIVRVLIESAAAEETWSTVGASANIIEASRMALLDSLEYRLVREGAG